MVKLAVTTALLAYLLSGSSIDEVFNRVQSVSAAAFFFCCAALFMLTLTTAIRWKLILQHLAVARPLTALWRYTIIASFFNQLLPTGFGGDVFRVWYARTSKMSLADSVASVVIDRILGLVAVAVFVVAGIPYIATSTGPGTLVGGLLIAALTLMALLGVFLFFDVAMQLAMRYAYVHRLPQGIVAFALTLERTVLVTRKLLVSWPAGALVLGLSIANQFVVGSVVFALGHSMGADFAFYPVLVLFPYAVLLSMLPISLAGWGVRESTTVLVLALTDTSTAIALSVSVLYGLCLLVASTPGLVVWILSGREKKGVDEGAVT